MVDESTWKFRDMFLAFAMRPIDGKVFSFQSS